MHSMLHEMRTCIEDVIITEATAANEMSKIV